MLLKASNLFHKQIALILFGMNTLFVLDIITHSLYVYDMAQRDEMGFFGKNKQKTPPHIHTHTSTCTKFLPPIHSQQFTLLLLFSVKSIHILCIYTHLLWILSYIHIFLLFCTIMKTLSSDILFWLLLLYNNKLQSDITEFCKPFFSLLKNFFLTTNTNGSSNSHPSAKSCFLSMQKLVLILKRGLLSRAIYDVYLIQTCLKLRVLYRCCTSLKMKICAINKPIQRLHLLM